MIVADAGDRGDIRLNDIGHVESTTRANLDDGHVHEVGLAALAGATLTPKSEHDFGGNFYNAVLTPVVNSGAKHKTQSSRAGIQVGGLGSPVPTIALLMGTTTHDHDMLQTQEGQSAAVDITPNYFNISAFIRS